VSALPTSAPSATQPGKWGPIPRLIHWSRHLAGITCPIRLFRPTCRAARGTQAASRGPEFGRAPGAAPAVDGGDLAVTRPYLLGKDRPCSAVPDPRNQLAPRIWRQLRATALGEIWHMPLFTTASVTLVPFGVAVDADRRQAATSQGGAEGSLQNQYRPRPGDSPGKTLPGLKVKSCRYTF
jgi:hypothetical protein